MKTKCLSVSLIAMGVVMCDANAANVYLSTTGKNVANLAAGSVIGSVDLSNYITNTQLDSTMEQVILLLYDKAEEVTVAKNAAESAANAVASKVNASDLNNVAFTGNASSLTNDTGWVNSSEVSGLLSSATDDMATKTWVNSNYASLEWTQNELNDIGEGMVNLAQMTSNATNVANAATSAIESKADKATTLAGYGITDAANTDLSNLTSGAQSVLADIATNAISTALGGTDIQTAMDAKVNSSDLAIVATTGKASDLDNDAGFITSSALSDYAKTTDVYSKSDIDSTFATQSTVNALNQQLETLSNAYESVSGASNDMQISIADAAEAANEAKTTANQAAASADIAQLVAIGLMDETAGLRYDLDTLTDTVATKANLSDVYTKSELDSHLAEVSAGLVSGIGDTLSDYATTAGMNTMLETKADMANVYSKSDIDTKISGIVDGELAKIDTSLSELTVSTSTANELANQALAGLESKVNSSDLATVATTGKSSDLDNDAGFVTKDVADLANYTTTQVLNSMMAEKVSMGQMSELLSGVANTATISLAAVNNVDSDCTVANAIESLDKTIGAAITDDKNGLLATNSVNENIMALSHALGDCAGMHDGNAITNGTGEMPETVVSAINNIDETIGKIHGLFDGTVVDSTRVKSTTGAGSNLAIGTTVEDHLVALDNAVGNRNISSANATINAAAAVSISDALSATGNLIGNMDFMGTNYLGGVDNITDALRTLDANIANVSGGASVAKIAAIEHQIDKVEDRMNKGMAAMSALTALVPNARASGRTQLSVGTGTYGDKVGIAAGAFHYVNNRVLLNAGASYGGSGDMAFRAGITFGW